MFNSTPSLRQRIAAFIALIALAAPTAAQQPTRPMPLRVQRAPAATGIEPPPGLVLQAPASAVILKPGSSATSIRALPITRQHTLAALRNRPQLALGEGRVDLKPLLANPKALPNIAQRLRAEPQVAEITLDDTQVFEIDRGLVVHSQLGYRLRTGACSDPARHARLAATGLRCFTRMAPQARAAAFADPRDPHYVADPRRRADALRKAEEAAVAARADIGKDIAQLRAMLADPAQRAAIAAEIGAAEAARLASLDDAHLEAEVVNAGETRIEQVLFVPSRGQVDRARFARAADLGASVPAGLQLVGTGAPAADAPPIDRDEADRPMQPHVFLTGFTLGRDYEWRQRVETSINWCLLGCRKTYYAEVYAGFGYGFGLRFPMTLAGTYHYRRVGATETASVTANFRPIDGSAADYAASGLPGAKLFDGKELVAQFNAYAGAGYHVPFFPDASARFDLGKDFTDGLPAPYAGGQLTPPAPGQPMPPINVVFDDIDLIGGRANFGVVGAQVFPALQATLHSDALAFTLRDNLAGTSTPLTADGQTVPLKVDPTTHASDFSVSSPVYNLGFRLTPGLDARLFIDIEVWSDHWDWPVWFPQVAVDLPPGGVDFACHAETVCTRNYRFTRTGSIESTGAGAAFLRDLDAWTSGFESRWAPQCADDICRTGIRLLRLDTSLRGQQMVEADAARAQNTDANAMAAAMAPVYAKAEDIAPRLVHESQVRLTQKAGQGWAILAQAVWSKRCSDLPCLDNVAALAQQMTQAAIARQQAEPDASSLQVQGEIGREFGAKFQAEIDASKARALAAAAKKSLPVKPILMQRR